MQNKIIAIDGTAASGKGTLARRLADKFGMAYLDTGKLYRYVGYSVLKAGDDPGDEETAVAMAQSLKNLLNSEELGIPALKSDKSGKAASQVAVFPGVRLALLDFQRDFAAKGAVLDGRDIGTVICPDATVKFFITAEIEIRAERRHKELQLQGIPVTYEAVLADMRERDVRDAGRITAPMTPADDAIVLDTSRMSADEVFESALAGIHDHDS